MTMNKMYRILVNPFEDISSNLLFMIGLVAYVMSSFLAYYSGNHFMGLISVKSGGNSSLLLSFYNNGIPIVLLTGASFFLCRIRNKNTRIIDVLNVVMISRIIIYCILLMIAEPLFFKEVLLKVELAILNNDFAMISLSRLDKAVLTGFGIIALIGLFYFFYFFISGIRFVMNSKANIDILWILILIFGLEIAFTLFHININ